VVEVDRASKKVIRYIPYAPHRYSAIMFTSEPLLFGVRSFDRRYPSAMDSNGYGPRLVLGRATARACEIDSIGDVNAVVSSRGPAEHQAGADSERRVPSAGGGEWPTDIRSA
jgi:hypothetical protein